MEIPEVFHSLTPAVVGAIVLSSVFFLYVLLKRNKNLRLPPSPPSLPVIGHLHQVGPLIHHSFHKLSTRYGPLMYLRLGSVPCIVASSPDVARDLLKTNELAFSSRRASLAIDHIAYGGLAFAFAPYGSYWRFIKKMSTVELLGSHNLGQFHPIRAQEIHELLHVLAQKSKRRESVNLTEELLKLTNNVICQMMMGSQCAGENSVAAECQRLVREVTHIFGEFNVSDFVWFCKSIDLQGFKKRYHDIRRRYDALLEKIITERQEKRRKEGKNRGDEDGKGRDFLDLLLDALEDEKAEQRITRDHIKALILDFITAGTDTTATSVEWALVELINNPTVLAKAREEIERVVGNERLVDESDTPNLTYIQAIAKESLRLHPPVPMVNRQSIEDSTVQGYHIPAGTMLFVNAWSIARNPDYWESPLEFKPERFMEGDALNNSLDVKGQSFHLLPFGSGRRGCPGINLAMREIPVMIASLIQCFDWDFEDKKVLRTDERAGLTVPRAVDFVCVPSLREKAPKLFN